MDLFLTSDSLSSYVVISSPKQGFYLSQDRFTW